MTIEECAVEVIPSTIVTWDRALTADEVRDLCNALRTPIVLEDSDDEFR